MKLFLVRHGQTKWNQEGKVQGHSDIGLNAPGLKQAAALSLWFNDKKINTVYASPLRRAMETASVIAKRLGQDVNPVDGLKELNHGELEGMPSSEIWSRHGKFFEQWLKNPGDIRIPGGETVIDLQQRAWKAVEGLAEKHPEDTLLVVGHHFTNLVIICTAIGLDLRNMWRLKQDETGVNIFLYNEFGWRMLLYNSLAHLL